MSSISEWRLLLTYWRTAWRQRLPNELSTVTRVIFAAIVAGLQILFFRQHQTVLEILEALGIVVLAYLASLVGETLLNVVARSPALLDQQKTRTISEQCKRIEVLLQEPRRSPEDEYKYRKAQEGLSRLPLDAVPALRHLCIHQSLKFGSYRPPPPEGMTLERAGQIYAQCVQMGLASEDRTTSSIGIGEVTYTIAPGMKNVLSELLFPRDFEAH
jgi:hypothetical protein